MNSTRDWLISLSRLSMLNAIALTLLGIQFLLPPAMIALIVLVPAIFALETRLVSIHLLPISGLLAIILSLLFFGLDMGIWTLVYFVLGFTCGIAQRIPLRRVVRVLLNGIACAVLVGGTVFLFASIAQLNLTAIILAISNLNTDMPLLTVGIGSYSFLAVSTGFGIDTVSGSVFDKLRATQAGIIHLQELK